MTTFDLTFDRTFRPLLIPGGTPPTQGGCRKEGVYLTWLTLQGGWMYWLFEGHVIRGQSTDVSGKAVQGKLSRSIQKTTAPTMILHTANLTEAEANAVGTIRESISIYMLKHNSGDSIEYIPVEIPSGDAQLWDPVSYTNNFTTTITLPGRESQRL